MAKNERYRMASTLRQGWEIQLTKGDWVAIAEHWYFTAPIRAVSMTLADGKRVSLAPRDQVMSRIPEAQQ